MKKLIFSPLAISFFCISSFGQMQGAGALENAVAKLDGARTAKEYETLEKEFVRIAASEPKDWLPNYYAAYCNARIGFLYQDDGEEIEPYSERGEKQAQKAQSLLDTLQQKKELAEVYTVLSLVYRTRVFINPMTYGRKFGTLSQQYRARAQELDPGNPRAIYVRAWELYNIPKMWGGDKDQAKVLANQSLHLLENAGTGIQPHWGKAEDEELLRKYK